MRREVALSYYARLFHSVALFSGKHLGFLARIASKLQPLVASASEILLIEGEVSTELFLICSGSITIFSHDSGAVHTTLGPSSSFGEIAMVFGVPRTASARAETLSELALLAKSDLEDVLLVYPSYRQEIESSAYKAALVVLQRKTTSPSPQL